MPLGGSRAVDSHVDAGIVFVQFGDGTFYGDTQDDLTTELLQHRDRTMQVLRYLVDVAGASGSAQGLESFQDALAAKQPDPRAESAVDALRKVSQRDGPAAAINKAQEMLAVAATRGKSQ